jgi:hypothetical protein
VRPGSRLQAPNAWCTKLFPTTFFTLRRRNVPPLDGENARHNDHGPIGNRTTLPFRLRYRAKLVHLRSNLKAQVHAVLAKEGVTVPMTDLFGVRGRRLLDEVHGG